MRVMKFMRDLLESPASYPMLTLWLIGGTAGALSAAGYLDLLQVLVLMTTALIILMLVSFKKELRKVHDLVDSTNDRMVNRITQLTRAIENAGNTVPEEPHRGEVDDES